MITIKSSFADSINRIEFYINKKNINTTKTVVFNDNSPKEDIANALNQCTSFFISENEIYCTIKLTDKEIEKEKEFFQNKIKYEVFNLKKWSSLNIDNKNQIIEYLKLKKLDSFIKSLE